MTETTEVRYLSDDREIETELVIRLGGNGDWYVAVVPKGQRIIKEDRSVRISTSGGAASTVPGLAPAIAEAFKALLNTHANRGF